MIVIICVIFISFSILVPFSLEECMYKKVSISVDLEEDIVLDPLQDDSDQLLWHVAILKKEELELKFLCGGTLVGPSHVITAASCVEQVASSELLVVAGLSLLRSPSHSVDNPHSVFTVAKKYYPYHQGDVDGDDLAVLKLQNNATFKTPWMIALEEKEKYSKHCFTLGWGLHYYQSSETLKHPNPSFQDSMNNILHHAHQSRPLLNKILDIRNVFGLSSTLLFQLSRIFDVLPLFHFNGLGSKYLPDEMCSADGVARVKAVRLSTKHPFKCLCHSTNRLCLYSLTVDNIDQQVDIGSPVFCKLKKQKGRSKSPVSSSRYILAGIITNKETEEIHWLKYGSSIDMITATNVTAFMEFILAAMLDKN